MDMTMLMDKGGSVMWIFLGDFSVRVLDAARLAGANGVDIVKEKPARQ